MNKTLLIPDFLPDAKEEDLKAAAKRRDNYALTRDLQAKEYNEAIVQRLVKDEESKAEEKD
jgi:hypothetical protein